MKEKVKGKKEVLAGKKVVDEIIRREVIFPLTTCPRWIQNKDYPSKIRPKNLGANRYAYGISDVVLLRALNPNVHYFVKYGAKISDQKHTPNVLQKVADSSERSESKHHDNTSSLRYYDRGEWNYL